MTRRRNIEAPPREDLERLYVTEGLRLTEVAAIYDVSITPVIRWLKEYGLGPRTVAEGRKRAVGKTRYSPEALAAKRLHAAQMREKVTPEARAKRAEKIRGRPAANKGKPMSEEQRQKLITQRADPEYRRQQSERQKGERGHNWKGGVDGAPIARLETWEWRARRRECYARDNYICQDCGVKCLGGKDARKDGRRKIQAHHIVARRDGGTDDLSNLVTLCVSCHHKRETLLKPRRESGRPVFVPKA